MYTSGIEECCVPHSYVKQSCMSAISSALRIAVYLLIPVSLSANVYTFRVVAGADTPVSQFIDLDATPPSAFQVTLAGVSGGPAPAGITVNQASGLTPARIRITVDPSGLAVGGSTVILTANVDQLGSFAYTISVTVVAGAPQLEVSPSAPNYAATAGSATPVLEYLYVRNAGGGGPQPYTLAVIGNTPWLTLNGSSGRTSATSPSGRISVNAQNLQPGNYQGIVRVTSGNVTSDIQISFFVALPAGPRFTLGQRGIRFDSQENVNSQESAAVSVNFSGTGSTNYTVEVTPPPTPAQDWLGFTPASGIASPAAAGKIIFSVKRNALKAGAYYALVKVTPSVAGASPQFLTAVYNVTTTAPAPTFSTVGFVFLAEVNGPTTAAQNIGILSNATAGRRFKLETTVDTPQIWLKAPNPSGTAGSGSPVNLPVSADPTGLKAGIYQGQLTAFFDLENISRSTDVLFVVLPAGAKPAAARDATTGCTPTKLGVIQTSTPSNFSTPAGWPTALSFRVLDDCANPVTSASTLVNFSNGDVPLSAPLTDPASGTYSATWVSNKAGAVTVTARVAAIGFPTITSQLIGAVAASKIPALAARGTLHNLYPQVGAALAPGTVATIYGSGLAAADSSPSTVPLPTEFNGTSIIIGGLPAPLYFVSDSQVNAEIPIELAANGQYAVVAQANGAIAVPEFVTLTLVAPGVAAYADGRMIAQHLDFTLVTPTSPAAPGEYLTMYLAGMGATNPSVPSGARTPFDTLSRVTAQATVTVNDKPSDVIFAGLTPGGIGLYQINFQIPSDTTTNTVNVLVKQNGIESNKTTIPVKQ